MQRNLARRAVFGSVVVVAGMWLVSCAPEAPQASGEIARQPDISPDYAAVTIPPNIAPLNFRILEEGDAYFIKVHSERGRPIDLFSRTGEVHIPLKPWRALLAENRGNSILLDVCVRNADGTWRRFGRITNTIAAETIDDVLVYRFMKPIYTWWKDMEIRQRDLTGYDVSVVLHGRSFGHGCLNCHSFVGNSPDVMTIGLRSATYGSYTLLARDGAVGKVGAKWGYTAWHPSGTLAVYSINKVRQFFQTAGTEVRDVLDLDSALVCYHVASQKAMCPEPLSEPNRLETYPAWSPDGRHLYYCSAPILWQDRDTVPPKDYDQVRYDLRRIPYEVETDHWGVPETVLSAEETGLSILLPRVSPDGRFLLFCMCRYGCFPIYQPSSDLYLMDLATGEYRKLEVNSDHSESWHSWSSNSRWIAFSSRRPGGPFTRTYLSYVDERGRAHKPFILPQRDPAYYDSLLEAFSVPELITGPVEAGKTALAQAARSAPSGVVDIPISGATPKAEPSDPWQQRE
ncbi:MAG: PD40 domain-containing protein [Sedimentisphaerales bacterium]|nr:PD40 domain-containing protein [Sedimentisphaerales bacterium]